MYVRSTRVAAILLDSGAAEARMTTRTTRDDNDDDDDDDILVLYLWCAVCFGAGRYNFHRRDCRSSRPPACPRMPYVSCNLSNLSRCLSYIPVWTPDRTMSLDVPTQLASVQSLL
ncbi:hypothetical protein LXA43DRAFT_633558 [Ganoderma leucocontextum]|nr:hypothetical protein LXA43DRAFT_633558 [Ganoderma leucocontextum]